MFKKSLSDPGGLDQLCQMSIRTSILPSCEEKVTTLSGSSVPWYVLEHVCSVHGQGEASHWKTEEISENNYILYAEEEEIWNSSDVNPQEKCPLVDLLHCRNRLMKANTRLQLALNASEDSKIDLENEIISFKNQIKRMKQVIHSFEKFREELDEAQAALAESEKTNHCLQASNYQVEKKNKTLIQQIEAITQEMSDILLKREIDKRKITALSQHIHALEQELEEAKILLDKKNGIICTKDVLINQQKVSMEELTNIGQVLKEKVKDLENKLELAEAIKGGTFLHSNGTLSVVTENHLSLAQESWLMTGFQQRDSDDAVKADDVPMDSKVAAWKLKGKVEEEDSSFGKTNMKVIKVEPEKLKENIKHEEVVEVIRNEIVEDVIHVYEGEVVKWVKVTAKPKEINHHKEVKEIIQFEEEKTVRLEFQAEFNIHEEVKVVSHKGVMGYIKPNEEKDLMEMKKISSLLAEEACQHEEVKQAIGHEEMKPATGQQEDRDIKQEISEYDEEKWEVVDPEKVLKHEEEREEVNSTVEVEACQHEEVQEAIGHEEVKPATGQQEDRDIKQEISKYEEEKWEVADPEKVLKHEEDREEVNHVVEVEDIAGCDDIRAVEADQTQFKILDEELAPEQNSKLDVCVKIKRGALITGAISFGAFFLWRIKSLRK